MTIEPWTPQQMREMERVLKPTLRWRHSLFGPHWLVMNPGADLSSAAELLDDIPPSETWLLGMAIAKQ